MLNLSKSLSHHVGLSLTINGEIMAVTKRAHMFDKNNIISRQVSHFEVRLF